jgi:membrane-associated phospholipid phosphatase
MNLDKRLTAAGDALLDLDDRVQGLFEAYAGTPPIKALDLTSKLGNQPEIRFISGALIAAGTFSANDRLVRAGARMMIAHGLATVAKDLVKTEVDRTRPRSANGKREKKPKKGNHTAKEVTSFPSGHSAGAIAAARAFSREYPEYRGAAIAAGLFIALAQIPRCAHYPTDVAAGLAMGLVSEALTDALWNAASMDERSA